MGLSMNGTALAVNVADSPSLAPPAAFSFSAWVIHFGTHFNDHGVIYCKTNPVFGAFDFGPFWQIGVGPTVPRKLALFVGGTAPFAFHISTGDVPTILDYQHIASTFDGTTVRHYINGQLDSTIGGISGVPNNPAFGPQIGNRPDLVGFNFEGAIEDLRFYGRALSGAEVATLHATQGRDGIVAGLRARWPMQGEIGVVPPAGTIEDISGNANQGTQTGGVVYLRSRTLISKRPA